MPTLTEERTREAGRSVARTAARGVGRAVVRKTARRLLLGSVGTTTTAIVLTLLLLFLVIAAAAGKTSQQSDTTSPSTAAGITGVAGVVQVPATAPATLRNAATIANVAYSRYGTDTAGQLAATIGIDVAIAETGLLNDANDGTSADYGYFDVGGHRELDDAERAVARQSMAYPHDGVGHNLDSIGLFQQRPSASWGTPAQLIDPATSAGKFYDALNKVSGWQTLPTYTAAQDVQGSNDPTGGIYAQVWDQAVSTVKQLATYRTAAGPGSAGIPGSGGVVSGGVVAAGVQVSIPAGASIAGTINAPNQTVAKAIAAGLSELGTPYSWGGGSDTGPTLGICGPDGAENDCHIVGFDCSGLMMYVYAQVGIQIGHYTQTIWDAAQQIPWDQRMVGDMVGYGGGGENHITMYIGDFAGVPMQLEAPYSGAFVRISPIRDTHHPVVYRVWAGAR